MKNVETITGQVSNIERVGSSKNGNPRYRCTISESDTNRILLVYTAPDSMLGYKMGNYKSGDTVTADIGWHYGTVTLANIR